MREYLEKILHQTIEEHPYDNIKELPLSCRNAFKLNMLKIGMQEFIAATPIEDMNLTELRKMRLMIERYTDYPCAFNLKKVNWYAAPRMLEEGIPFVWENHQIYLPFMGVLLDEKGKRKLKNCVQISFLTQKLILKALYENWQDVSVTKAAALLGVTRMSITRCYDEIEALGIPLLKSSGKSRRFHAIENKKVMWDTVLPFLRNPVIKTFRLEDKLDGEMILSGISALAKYSMLDEDTCTIYAVRKDQIGTLGIKKIQEVPLNEEPTCIIQELGYILPFGDGKAIDPLSVELTLTDEELEDPRVRICIDEMLEELVW